MQKEMLTREPEGSPRSTPILFVHGAWHGAWCWDEYFLPYFAQHGYMSYALSMRGHGGSPGLDRLRWKRIADYVADVAQVVSQFERAPVLVGHSLGGLVVQKYLESHQAPAAVLLASEPPSGVLRTTMSTAFRHPLAFLKTNLTLKLYHIVDTPSLTHEAFFSPDMATEKVAAYFDRMQSQAPIR